jgi:hypothetical protein
VFWGIVYFNLSPHKILTAGSVLELEKIVPTRNKGNAVWLAPKVSLGVWTPSNMLSYTLEQMVRAHRPAALILVVRYI